MSDKATSIPGSLPREKRRLRLGRAGMRGAGPRRARRLTATASTARSSSTTRAFVDSRARSSPGRSGPTLIRPRPVVQVDPRAQLLHRRHDETGITSSTWHPSPRRARALRRHPPDADASRARRPVRRESRHGAGVLRGAALGGPSASNPGGDVRHPADGIADGAVLSPDAILLYPRRRPRARPRADGAPAAVAACALGMGCKEVMVSAPLVVLLYDRMLHRRLVPRGAAAAMGLYLGAGGDVAHPRPARSSRRSARTRSRPGSSFRSVTPLRYARSEPGVILHYLRWRSGRPASAWTTTGRSRKESAEIAARRGRHRRSLLAATVWALARQPMWGFARRVVLSDPGADFEFHADQGPGVRAPDVPAAGGGDCRRRPSRRIFVVERRLRRPDESQSGARAA